MRAARAVLGSTVFFVLAPGVAAGLAPYWITGWRVGEGWRQVQAVGFPVGSGLIVAGLVVLLSSFARFALDGFGTPAPIMPTQRLVVTGYYRFIRNPMYVAVTAIVVGQALFFGSAALGLYAALLWLTFHAFVLGYEEPTLRRTYGAAFDTYCAHVPRWIPRLTPWRPDASN